MMRSYCSECEQPCAPYSPTQPTLCAGCREDRAWVSAPLTTAENAAVLEADAYYECYCGDCYEP